MSTSIPTLGGWILSPEQKADYILSCFLTSRKRQSVLFQNDHISMAYLLNRYTGDVYGLEADLQVTLEQLFKAAFAGDQVNVQVKLKVNSDDKKVSSIQFMGTIISGGKTYSVARLVKYENSKLVAIDRLTTQ